LARQSPRPPGSFCWIGSFGLLEPLPLDF
jgi:hypothetical protein